jgi:hypothetical protein
MKWFMILLPLVFLLTACGGDDNKIPDEDPIPNIQAGLEAFYSGDLAGVDRYWCDEILLDAKDQANEAALGNAGIDLSNTNFEIVAKQTEDRWTVKMTGVYSVWMENEIEQRDTDVVCPSLIGLKAEDGIWKICGFGTDPECTPQPTPLP